MKPLRINPHGLQLLDAVARTGSVTKAAELLRISQPAVTMQLRKLEQEVGLTLLASRGRGILLTEAGQFVALQARRLVALEDELSLLIHEYREGRTGSLRLAATYLPANFLLPAWMSGFKRAAENVKLILHTSNADRALDMLLTYEAELAFVGGRLEAGKGLVRKALAEDPMWFVVPPGHRLADRETTLGEMLQEPFIMREEGSSTRSMLISLCRSRHVDMPRIGLELGGMNEAVRAVAAGYGTLFASATEVREFIARGEVARVRVQVPGPPITNPLAVYWRDGDPLSVQAERFLAWIFAHPVSGIED
ncbi:DNA-binding transcriptional regulator, LysR family [Paenibacillus sp. UNCCL117]|uniref:LysR family transcriptional regulator n=1 Tax=unclassified Paenibacillus TaxID=185978 RepID=UPI0008868F03|nr:MULTISPECIES: LysR family transcriptional regulator [unclassified Paenibacillus]SDB99035.1 DNA-binding transcriptional regulator, LysR family [Paenibacillus sp. cl123]SFW69053.1 DNA-binding transcriptional regulator, LysR family [Paenibacillus sp. UNCCL117]